MVDCQGTAELVRRSMVILRLSCTLEWPHAGDHVAVLTWPVDPDDRMLASLDFAVDDDG